MKTEVREMIRRVLSTPVEDWEIKWEGPGHHDRRCIRADWPEGTVEVRGRRELEDLIVNAFYRLFGVDVHVKLVAPDVEIEVFYGCHRKLGRLVDEVYRRYEKVEEERREGIVARFTGLK